MTNQSNDTKNGAEVGQVLPNERHRNVKRSFLVLLFLALAWRHGYFPCIRFRRYYDGENLAYFMELRTQGYAGDGYLEYPFSS